MSFIAYKDIIEEGDIVILYLGYDNLLTLKVEAGKVHQTKYGALKHDSLIGEKFGSKVTCSKGYIHVLQPTPEIWTLALPHRTQILYSTDISMVIYQLDLRNGSIVVESGTGSGSLSHALIRTVAPDGHLHTFDFHAERVQLAQKEFDEHQVAKYVTARQQDVCENGFDLPRIADAVFLDLPGPWTAIPHAKKCLKHMGRVCSFSPCIEQVQKVCESLKENSFQDIRTFECLQKPYEAKTIRMPIANLGLTNEEQDYNPSLGNITQNEGKDCFEFKSGCRAHIVPGHTGYLTFATLFDPDNAA
ncbi:DgyrCDS359 [Dimorphilus gyrociliatus]|uniref:tRNA (adenine(58)-N(1))-methyltransferase catalytic subunit TRMT61A n=1 Tax=Dimorphilus gyrociliatus TaxID=2664684 RepID=A0A7I8V8S2_9ANNE|nr:DgyrCDS359 [Dimorphilus gyrociliatus]